MKTPLVSIIIPAYNSASTIKKCINSLLAQSYDNIQILIIDDGSADDTCKIVSRLIEKDRRVCYYYQINKGVSAARNHGIDMAEGKYIIFVDADDWVEKDYVKRLVYSMLRNKVQLSISGWIKETAKGQIIETCPKINKKVNRTDCLKHILSIKGCQGYPFGKIFKTEIISAYHLYFNENVSIFEDLLFVAQYVEHINSAYIDTVRTYHYIISEGGVRYQSIHEKQFNPKWLSEISALETILKNIQNHEAQKIIKARIALSSVFYIKRMAECNYKNENALRKLQLNLKRYSIYPFICHQGDIKWKTEAAVGAVSVKSLLQLLNLPQIR